MNLSRGSNSLNSASDIIDLFVFCNSARSSSQRYLRSTPSSKHIGIEKLMYLTRIENARQLVLMEVF